MSTGRSNAVRQIHANAAPNHMLQSMCRVKYTCEKYQVDSRRASQLITYTQQSASNLVKTIISKEKELTIMACVSEIFCP